MQILACGVAACALGGSSAVASASAASPRIRVGSAAKLPAGARLGGSLASSRELQLTVALQPRDPSGLQSFATAVSTPGSPDFRHYLSVSQFAQTYGATASQIAAVQSALRSEGLTVGAPMANHLTLSVSGTAAKVERAFSTKLSQVTLASGRSAYANTDAPTLAPDIAGDVQGVIGLNNLVVEQPEGLARAHSGLVARSSSRPNVVTGGPQPCASASGVSNAYTADLISSAYNFSSLYQAGDLGAGQTVALYELEPFNPADIGAYEQCYQTAPSISNVNVDSAPAFAPGDDDGEAALDIEQVIGLAPKANIIVYQAPNSGKGAIDEYSTIVSQNTAKVVSSSWGECEADALISGAAAVTEENTLLQEAAAQGQTVYVASGDTGSAACSQANPSDTGLSVQDPSSQPFATGVGGTTLFTLESGNPFLWTPGNAVDQSVWNDGTLNGPGKASASTGGISIHWPMPSYQSGAATSVGVINSDSSGAPCDATSGLCREVPDVSANADPESGYAVFTGGAWGDIGGTSAAAPLWAAFTALVNDEAACRGVTVGFANPALYQIASSAYASNISDVTLASPITGDADNDGLGVNGGLFPVTTGYDMATGLGSPIVPALASSLCAVKAPVYTVTVTGPGNQSGTVGKAVSVHMHATDSGGAAVLYTASGLPAGLTINAASGLISGKPTTAGTSSVAVFATDGVHNTGGTRFTWKITKVGKPTTSGVKLQGVDKGKAKLTFTATAGSNAPALKSVSISLPSGLSFSKKSKTLDKGLVVKSGSKRLKFKLHPSHSSLTISFTKSTRKVTVTIAKPAISVSGSLRLKALHHKVKKLTVTFRVTNTSNATTKFSTKLALKP